MTPVDPCGPGRTHVASLLTWVAGGAALVGLIGAGQSLHDGSELRIGPDSVMIRFVVIETVAIIVYFGMVVLTLRAVPPRGGLLLILGVGAAMRAIPLVSPMFLSSDLFRYIWDGRVQLAGINPYRFVPGDAALASLRDTAIFSHVNRAMYAHTIYPPVAQLFFAAVAFLDQSPFAMRAAMVMCEAVAVACLLRALRHLRRPRAWILIYLWNPLAAWEFAGNGHVDALAIALVSFALLAAVSGYRALTGIALAAATLTKLLPAVLAPALWRRWDWRMPLAGLLTAVALYACYAGAGARVIGFLPAYTQEEGLTTGTGLWALAGLSKLVSLPDGIGAIYAGAAAVLMLGASAVLIVRRAEPAAAAAILIVLMTILLSPHYPWYFVWASVAPVLRPQRAPIFLGAAALWLYLDPFHERFWWPALVYLPTLVLLAADIAAPLSIGDR